MFFRKRKSRGGEAVPDWRKVIRQDVKMGDTSVAEGRRRWEYFRVFFVLLSAFTMFVVIALVAERLANGGEEEERLSFARMKLMTNGAIEENWVRDFLNIREARSNVSVISLRKKLESYPQIRKARVVREGGNVLRIELQERAAIARFRAEDGRIFNIGDDGILFPAETYFATIQDTLPFVLDVEIAQDKNGFESIVNADLLLDFLNVVRRNYPKIRCNWESVSAKDLPHKLLPMHFAQPWAVLRVKPSFPPELGLPRVREIVFSAQNFRKELALLASADSMKKIREHYERFPAEREKSSKIVFITNRKNTRRPVLEMRIIPLQETRGSGRMRDS